MDFRRFFVLLLSFIFVFGCITQQDISDVRKEQIASTEYFDVNDDGINEIIHLNFNPIQLEKNIKLKREVIITANLALDVSSFDSISDADELTLLSNLNDFSASSENFINTCSNKVGLEFNCVAYEDCADLCAGASSKCAKLEKGYRKELGWALVDFVKDRKKIEDTFPSLRFDIKDIGDATAEKKISFVKNAESLLNAYSSFMSNDAFLSNTLNQCDKATLNSGDFLLEDLEAVLSRIGSINRRVSSYDYKVVIHLESDTLDELSVVNLDIVEKRPSSANDVSSFQTSDVGDEIKWSGAKLSPDAPSLLFVYSFSSSVDPNQVINQFTSPSVITKELSLEFLNPVLFVYGELFNATKDYHLSFGLSFALFICLFLFLYSFLKIIIAAFGAMFAREKSVVGIKKAFSQTRVTWKGDLVLGIIAFVVAAVSSHMFATSVTGKLSLTESFDLWTKEDIVSFVSVVSYFLGTVLLYLAIENKLKILFLGGFYNKEIKEDKQLFVNNISSLKEKLKELKSLIEKLSKEGFDVGKEYDALASISLEKIDTLSKKTDDVDAKRTIDLDLSRVDDAIEALHEKKKTADENWAAWSSKISALVQENDEVYVSSLNFIPSSLRSWTLNKFVEEHKAEGFVFEDEAIKKKAISVGSVAEDLVKRGVFYGLVLTKFGKVLSARIKDTSDTVISILSLRSFAYLSTLVKNLRTGDYVSVVSIGSNLVLVFLKHEDFESMALVEKSKFKTSVAKLKETLERLS